jgi:hypothetical protein
MTVFKKMHLWPTQPRIHLIPETVPVDNAVGALGSTLN